MNPWAPIAGGTPIDDVSGLKIKAIRNRAALNLAEAENIRRAVMKYLATKPSRRSARFDVKWMKRLHREMFGSVWSWAGEFRRRELNLGVPPEQIETRLHNLALDLAHWEKAGLDLIEQAAMLHHRAVTVHPFLNGNGRWARLLANIWLALHGEALTQWPEETIGGASVVRAEYLAAVRAADAGDYAALVKLHRRFTDPAD